MKNKFYKILFFGCFLLLLTITKNIDAQTTIYYQNFDGSTFSAPSLPAGWVTKTNALNDTGWVTDSTNFSTGYIGASGERNLLLANDSLFGSMDTVISENISTSGYTNITVIYGSRRSKHFSDYFSAITSFAFSPDSGTTWDTIAHVENPENSNWYLINDSVPMVLPVSAANNPHVLFRWTAQLNQSPSGTYRIDDFKVMGTLTNGISEYKDQNSFKVYIDNDKFLHLTVDPSFNIPPGSFISVYDVTGRVCVNEGIITHSNIYSLSDLKQGVYFVTITANDLLFAQKIINY